MAEEAAARPDGTGLEHFLEASSAYQAEHLGCLPKLWNTDHHLVQSGARADRRPPRRRAGARPGPPRPDEHRHLPRDVVDPGRARDDRRSNAPEAWKRHLDLLVAGMRPTDAELAHRPLSQSQVDRILSQARRLVGQAPGWTDDHAAGHRRGHGTDGATSRAHWWILVIIAGAQLMVVLDTTIMIIALPSAQHALGFSNTDRQWVVTAYTLAFGGFLLLGGRISDMIGPKRTLMIGVAGLRTGVGPRRRGPDHAHADRRPRAAGPLRRAAGALGALDPDLDLHRPTRAGPGLRDLRHHRHRRLRLRAHPRRLPDPVRRLALVPVRQPAHRRARPLRRLHA